MSLREEKKEKRRVDILHAGLDLFVAKGYSGTKTVDIAEKVGMSSGLMFKYFPTKESLYKELVAIGLSDAKRTLKYKPETSWDYFENVIEKFIGSITVETDLEKRGTKMFLLMSQAFVSDDVPQKVSAMANRQNIINMSLPFIKAGQKDGTIRDGDPYAIAMMFWGSMRGFAQIYLKCEKKGHLPQKEWFLDILRA